MIKKILTLSMLLTALCLTFLSCLSSDDDVYVDEEWKSLNERAFNAYQDDESYTTVTSPSANGFIYWKRTTAISDTDIDPTPIVPEDPNYYAQFNDSVYCRYVGWYFDKQGEKVTFDSTESGYNKVERGFLLSSTSVREGWRTALQYMKAGDEREFIIPWVLGSGTSGYQPSTGSWVPSFTTLYYQLKLNKTVKMKGQS